MKLNYVLGVGIVLSLVGVSLLLAFGFLYLKPYLDVADYRAARCTTVSMAGDGLYVSCECATDGSSACESRYPCIKARVNVTAEDEERVTANVTLYDSYETYYLQHSVLQCSYHKCNRDAFINIAATQEFFIRYSANASFSCYYNPADMSFALVDVVTLPTVVNCMFWPSLAFLVGIIIFFRQVFHVDEAQTTTQRNQFSSLERQWARIRERSYGSMTSTGSERLVKAEGLERASHNAVCAQN
jgi:hypothetical protein